MWLHLFGQFLKEWEHFKCYYVDRNDCFSLLLPRKVPQGATGVPPEIVSYYHPNLTLNLVDDHTHWVEGTIPQPMDKCEWSLLKVVSTLFPVSIPMFPFPCLHSSHRV